jgi:hypothetical protein
MPQVYLEVKVPKAGKFERPCPLPDITEYAALFNRDRSSARSKVDGFINQFIPLAGIPQPRAGNYAPWTSTNVLGV